MGEHLHLHLHLHYSLRNNPFLIHLAAAARNNASGKLPTCFGIIAFFLVEYRPEDVRKRPKHVAALPHVCK